MGEGHDRQDNLSAAGPSVSCDSIRERAFAVINQVRDSLSYLSEQGVQGVDCSAENLKRIATWGKGIPVPPDTWESIFEAISHCRKCGLYGNAGPKLKEIGPGKARLVLVVSFPNREFPRPFFGPAGELLLKIVQAMHLKPEDIYLLNLLKCSPDKTISPVSPETAACLPFLKRQLAVIKPEVVCVMGPFAVQAFFKTEKKIEALRGRFHDYHGMKVMPTHHPESLLVDPSKKREVWEDVKKIMEALG